MVVAVYGLRDAQKEWFETVREYLFSMGGTSHPNDSAVFMWTKDSLIMSKEGLDGLGGVLAVHVDDFLWAGISEFKTKIIKQIKQRFPVGEESSGEFVYTELHVKTLIENGEYLGIEVQQHDYVEGITRHAEKDEDVGQPPRRCSPEEHTKYRGMVGQLAWATGMTRPDKAFETNMLAAKSNSPTTHDLVKADKVVQKIQRVHVTLKYPKLKPPLQWITYSDAAWANLDQGHTAGGYILCLAELTGKDSDATRFAPVTWRCKRVRRVARSTFAAETLVAVDAMDESVALNQLLTWLTGWTVPVNLRVDCKSLHDHIYKSKGCTEKRLVVELESIKQAIRNEDINRVDWVETTQQLADALTKKMTPIHLLRVLRTGVLD